MKKIFFIFYICIVTIAFLAKVRNTYCQEEELDWQACVQEAAFHNPQLIASSQVIAQNEANQRIQESALLPLLNAQIQATLEKAESKERSQHYSFGVSGTQLLFDGRKTMQQVLTAKEQVYASKEAFRFISAQLRYNLRKAFIDLLEAQQLISVNEEIMKMRRDSLELITLRYESGLEHRGALLTAEANAENARFSLHKAQRALSVAQRKLAKELGRTTVSALRVKGDFRISELLEQEPDFAKIAQNHPSLRQALAEKNIASFNIKSAQAQYLPTIKASYSAVKTGTHIFPDAGSLEAGVSLTIPVLEGGLRMAQLAQAQAGLRKATQELFSTTASIYVSLEESWQALQDAVENVEVKKKALEAAEERAQIAEAQYQIGFMSFDSWVIIQNDFVNAKRAYLQAQVDALRAEAAWLLAKGETIEYAYK